MNRGILSAMQLAGYIYYKYDQIENKISKEISPLKLQKSLYFCFAYWGAFAYNGNRQNNELNLHFDEYLFNDVIEAWVYGPVVPEVYHNRNKIKKCTDPDKLFKGHEYVREYIDGVLNDVLNASDFSLVRASHEDSCWKRHFKSKNIFHNIEIPKPEIIREYVKQI